MNPYESPGLDSLEELRRPVVAEYDRERFCALHVMLFVIGAAISLGFIAYSYLRLGWWPPLISWVYNVPYVGISGVTIAAVMLAIYRRWTRSNIFPKHFGHWFLIWEGVSWFVLQPYESIFYVHHETTLDSALDSDISGNWSLIALMTIYYSINMLLIAWAIWHCSQEGYWRLYGIVRFASSAWSCVQMLCFSQGNLWALTLIVGVIVLAMVSCFGFSLNLDLRRLKARDYLHWVGLGVEAMSVGRFVKYAALLLYSALTEL